VARTYLVMASTTAEVAWQHLLQRAISRISCITIIDAIVFPVGDDATGQLLSGETRVRGRGIVCKIDHDGDKDRFSSKQQKGQFSLAVNSKLFGSHGAFATSWYYSLSPSKSERVYWDRWIKEPGLHYIPNGSQIVIFKIETFSRKRHDGVSYCLMLKRSTQHLGAFELI
jgi:hypothetical protein